MKQEYKPLYEKFGLNVVYYRKRKKLTQLQLAELVDIDRSHISAIELGNVGVSFDVIFKMCEVLDIEPKSLFDFREQATIRKGILIRTQENLGKTSRFHIRKSPKIFCECSQITLDIYEHLCYTNTIKKTKER